MKLYEAIAAIVNDFGKEFITNIKVINVFSDFNAFEESKTFKIIIKNLIAEGYMDQLLYVRDWEGAKDRLINNFISATSFNEVNASYVIKSFAYGLGYTKNIPSYQPSSSSMQSHSKQSVGVNLSPNNKVITSNFQGVKLDKTIKQFENMSEETQRKYKSAAEAYLESIIEFKSDFEKDLGVKINKYVEFDQYGNILPKFEIDGKIKIKYDYAIMFYLLIYDNANKLIGKKEIYVGTKRNSYEVVETAIEPFTYHKVENIKRIVVYWEKD